MPIAIEFVGFFILPFYIYVCVRMLVNAISYGIIDHKKRIREMHLQSKKTKIMEDVNE